MAGHNGYIEHQIHNTDIQTPHLCCTMVSVFASNAVDRGFDPRSCQTKDYAIYICC